MATKFFDNYTDFGQHIELPGHAQAALQKHFGRYMPSGRIFVAAASKTKAIETLTSVGFGKVRPVYLRIGAGNDLSAAMDSGVLEEGAVFVKHATYMDSPLFRITAEGTYPVGTFAMNETNHKHFLRVEPFTARKVLVLVNEGEDTPENILAKVLDRDCYEPIAGDDALLECINAYEGDEQPFRIVGVTVNAALPTVADLDLSEVPVAAAVGLRHYL